jgi:hypothetical protein
VKGRDVFQARRGEDGHTLSREVSMRDSLEHFPFEILRGNAEFLFFRRLKLKGG